MARASLQHFELQVLLAVLRLGEQAYSVSIVADLERRSERSVAPAAVFIALRRLEAKGLVRSRLDDRNVPDTGRVRRYVKATRLGIKAVREAHDSHARLWRGLERVLRSERS